MSNDPELEAVKRELQELKKELTEQKRNFNNKSSSDLSNQIAIGLIKAFIILLGVNFGIWVIVFLVALLMSFISNLSSSLQPDQNLSTNKNVTVQVRRSDNAIASEVRSKLAVNLSNSKLAISAKNGTVTVSGTVSSQSQLNRIEPLAKQIAGVKNVVVKVTIATAASN